MSLQRFLDALSLKGPHVCMRSMRASASDTELNRLDAASVGVQRFLSPGIAADAALKAGPTGKFRSGQPCTYSKVR